ncbi:hypothetical protein [Nocardia rhamnosiphila]
MDEWPDWVQQLPIIDTPVPGGRGHLLASPDGQLVFWTFPAGANVARHQHGPQIGVVIAGHVELTAGQHTHSFGAGGYFDLGDEVPHSAVVAPGTLVIEIFADHDRHTAAEPKP